MIALRQLHVEDWALFRELRLAALADAPDAFGARLADWSGPRDSEPRWRARLTDVPFNLIALEHDRPLGMVSATGVRAGVVELLSMWVAPLARGRGVSAQLITSVLTWARQQSAHTLLLKVYETNTFARASYQRSGFVRSRSAESRRDSNRGELVLVRALAQK